MAITSGTRIGPYEVTSRIGEGGMGVVYRARDTQLQRSVALKVLPDHFAGDSDRLERFQREAQLLASLNHPNIAHIYGLERTGDAGCIVMELVEGETLAERIKRGPFPIDDVLPIARQIADAVEAAHAQGIVHRDLKPANIKLTPDGKVKVLDFGLAKALGGGPEVDPSNSPTVLSGSMPGMVMGTAAYMSPEQARGKAVDARTDIWAFGCVLFEMLTAQRAFDGETATDIVAKIIQGGPDWDLLPADVPSSIRALLKILLSKDPNQRLQHIGDARVLFNHTFVDETPRPAPPVRAGRGVWLVRVAVALAFLALLVPASLYFLRVPEEPSEIRFEMPAPGIISESIRVSPDGQRVAYVASTNGKRQVWVRSIGALSAQPLPGTEYAANYLLGWAPDSRRLGFFADGKLKKIDITVGTALAIADTTVAVPGAWNSNGDILFSTLLGSTAPIIARVSDSGGEATPITRIDSSAKEVMHVAPVFLPDGRRFVYARPTLAPDSQWQIAFYVGSLDSKSTTRLRPAGTEGIFDPNSRRGTGSPPVYVSPGYWLGIVNGTLLAARMNADGSFAAGDPVRLADNVAGFSASEKLLLYLPAAPGVEQQPNSFSRLVWFDRSGKQGATAGDPGPYVSVDLSPDDRRAVATRGVLPSTDLWVIDIDRGGQDRLTSNPGLEFFPVWSPDGREIAFSSQGGNAVGAPALYRRSSISVGGDTLLVKSDTPNEATLPEDWSSDGKTIVFGRRLGAAAPTINIWYMTTSGNAKPVPYLESQSQKAQAQLSPDGRWLAYATNESGNAQIVVQSFPDPKIAKVVVTRNGGTEPRWRHDGRELFYLAPDGKLMAVLVKSGDTFEAGTEAPLFQTPLTAGNVPGLFRYDVSADGKRFLIISPTNSTAPTPSAADSTPITAVVNWTAALRKK